MTPMLITLYRVKAFDYRESKLHHRSKNSALQAAPSMYGVEYWNVSAALEGVR